MKQNPEDVAIYVLINEKKEKKYEETYRKSVGNTKKYLNNRDIVLDFAHVILITTFIYDNIKSVRSYYCEPNECFRVLRFFIQ